MIAVLDASAAIEMTLNMKNAFHFKGICTEADIVLTPDIYPSEITNVFWKYKVFSNLDTTKCLIRYKILYRFDRRFYRYKIFICGSV